MKDDIAAVSDCLLSRRRQRGATFRDAKACKLDVGFETPVAFRHWVASALGRAGLSVPASAYWMGHDPTLSGANAGCLRQPEDCFAEQSAKLPTGPMMLLEPPDVSVSEGLPREIVALIWDYHAGNIGTMEFASRMELLRIRPDASVITK